MASIREAANHLGISSVFFQDLLGKGVFERQPRGNYDLSTVTKSYIEYLRKMAAGRAGAGNLELVEERARLAKEQADAKEMENAVSRGELVYIEDVAKQFERGLEKVRTKLLAIPSKIAPEVHACASVKEVQAVIESNIIEALSELAGRYEANAGEEA
jgi:phage terminase Nu1 subunit (DNA packaging protein)